MDVLDIDVNTVLRRGRNGDFTIAEFDRLNALMTAAFLRGDMEEGVRIGEQIPLCAEVAKAAKECFGVESLEGMDITDANLKYGEGWLYE